MLRYIPLRHRLGDVLVLLVLSKRLSDTHPVIGNQYSQHFELVVILRHGCAQRLAGMDMHIVHHFVETIAQGL